MPDKMLPYCPCGKRHREAILAAKTVREAKVIALALNMYLEDHRAEFRRLGYIPPEMVSLPELYPEAEAILDSMEGRRGEQDGAKTVRLGDP